MSYWNEAGEPIMTAAQARVEAGLDQQAMYESYYDYDPSHDYDDIIDIRFADDEEDCEDED